MKLPLGSRWWPDWHEAILRAGLIFARAEIVINLITQIGNLVMTLMATPADVAGYYAAVRAALVVRFFFGASGMLAERTFTRPYAAGQRGEAQELATRSAITGAVGTGSAAAIGAVFAPCDLQFYCPEFIVALPSFVLFASGLVVRSLFGLAEQLLRATRSEAALLIATASALALSVVLTFALVPVFRILGAAIGSGLQFVVYGVLLARVLWRRNAFRSDVFVLTGAGGVRSRQCGTCDPAEEP